jgi:hypothetical protein
MTDLILNRTSWARIAFDALLIALLCLGIGLAVARFPPIYILAFAGLGAAIVVAWWNRGAFTGILILFMLHGVPFVNTQLGAASGPNALNDAIFVVLVVFLGTHALSVSRNKEQDRLTTIAIVWSACYLTWWLVKIVLGSPGIPAIWAVKYGSEFMGFSLLLPLGLLALRRRRHLEGFGFTLAAGAGIFAFGQILAQVAHVQIAGLIHFEKLAAFEGVARIVTPMNEPLMAAFSMAFAAAVLGPKRYRRGAAVVALLTGLGVALSFIRAEYVGEILGVIVISLIWARGSGWNPRRIRNVSYALTVGAVVAVAISTSGASASSSTSTSPLQAVVSRAVLGVTNLESQSGTAAIRLRQANLDLETLGPHWLAGLGFLSPNYHYVPGLREGSIRNDDLGSLSIVMTMGLIGLVLAYMPPIAALIYLVRRRYGFVQYGGAMYLAAALTSSVTLGAVATRSGLLVLCSMLILCLNATALETATA